MKLYDSKAWLFQRYVVEKKSLFEMAEEAGCSHTTINNKLRHFGIPVRRGRF